MRLGVLWQADTSAANYRAASPMTAMQERGHEIVWPDDRGAASMRRLSPCDVVHVYRRHDDETRRQIEQLRRAGVGITWDNDDDFANAPDGHPALGRRGGRLGAQRLFAQTAKIASLAHTVTTTTDTVASRYRAAGNTTVVIPNTLLAGVVRTRRRHRGLVIGWIAGLEHTEDARRLALGEALTRVVSEHPEVSVHCIGVDLDLPERYRHERFVPFRELSSRIRDFDIGIAALADTPFNRARSDIKVKEYAASGVPWLASPVTPYAGLGKDAGGRLVADGEWYGQLTRLVEDRRARRRLRRRGRAWARGQTISTVADDWETVFRAAAAHHHKAELPF
jgi:glycosyltransferase involved in cell wall biosynthesis